MRTTINIDDDVYELVRSVAESRSVPLGRIVSDFVRSAIQAPLRTKLVGGFHVVDLPPDGPVVTSEDVRRVESESK